MKYEIIDNRNINCSIKYTVNGVLHRENGPAVVYPDGASFWFMWGKCHRTDGPAEIEADGTERYWCFGEEITKQEFEERFSGANDVYAINGKIVDFDEYDQYQNELETPES